MNSVPVRLVELDAETAAKIQAEIDKYGTGMMSLAQIQYAVLAVMDPKKPGFTMSIDPNLLPDT